MSRPGEKIGTEVAETSIGFLLRRAAQRCKDVTVPVLKRNGLATHELTTMNVIHANDACILRTLAEAVGVEPPAMNRIVNSLEQKRLVCRKRYNKDKRYTFFELTEAGINLSAKATIEVQEAEDNILLSLKQNERQQMFISLRQLI